MADPTAPQTTETGRSLAARALRALEAGNARAAETILTPHFNGEDDPRSEASALDMLRCGRPDVALTLLRARIIIEGEVFDA